MRAGPGSKIFELRIEINLVAVEFVQLERDELDRFTQGGERADRIAAGIYAEDGVASPPQQLDQTEIVPVAPVCDEDVAVMEAVKTQNLLEEIAELRAVKGQLALSCRGSAAATCWATRRPGQR